MTVTALQPVMAQPARTGQGTAVEQSRAVAEVHAAIVVAQQCPRDVAAAVEAMRESCQQMALAERAFFRYPRGGQTITGKSVHLARELARIWGNLQYGITELLRDDDHAQSEVLAFAWDAQTNVRNSHTFIAPHKRDTKDGVKVLTDMRDIYESNANQGARRVREAIFAILPPWFSEEAARLCNETLENGGGRPLATRIADAIEGFERLGVTRGRIEAKFGLPATDWTAHDVAQLGVIYTSLKQGTVTVDEEFPAPARVTLEEVSAAAQAPAQDRPPAKATTGQVSKIEKEWKRLGYEDHDAEEMLIFTAAMAIVPAIAAITDLTQEQAKLVYDELVLFPDRASLVASVSPRVSANAQGSDAG